MLVDLASVAQLAGTPGMVYKTRSEGRSQDIYPGFGFNPSQDVFPGSGVYEKATS